MQHVWLSFFRGPSTSSKFRSVLQHVSTSAAHDSQAFTRPLWSSIAPSFLRPYPHHCTNHDRDGRSKTSSHVHHPFLSRNLHATPPHLKRRPRVLQPPSASPGRVRIPFGSISRIELATVFKYDTIDYNEGNEILRILHGRRVTGALVDRGVDMEDSDVPRESLQRALAWLRQKYPVDEQTAAEQWAEMEAQKVNRDYVERGERLGLLKKTEEGEAVAEAERDYSATNTGRSALDEYRRYNEEKARKAKEERVKSGEERESQEKALAIREAREERQLQFNERIAKKREERAKRGMVTPEDQEVPDLTPSARLAGPTVFGIAVILLVYNWAEYFYEPPTLGMRMYPEVPISYATIGGIVAINIGVFCLWRMPPLWRILNKYGTVAPALPFSFSIFGNTFSHRSIVHVASNMAGLALFGLPLHEYIGRGDFVALYVTGGVLGSLVSLWTFVIMRLFTSYSQGASGCVYAVMTAWSVFYWEKPTLPSGPEGEGTWGFVADVTRWSFLVLSVVPHFFREFWMKSDGMAHLGGAAIGLIGGLYMKTRNAAEAKRKDNEKRFKIHGSDKYWRKEP